MGIEQYIVRVRVCAVIMLACHDRENLTTVDVREEIHELLSTITLRWQDRETDRLGLADATLGADE